MMIFTLPTSAGGVGISVLPLMSHYVMYLFFSWTWYHDYMHTVLVDILMTQVWSECIFI